MSKVVFHYVDFDMSRKAATATVEIEDDGQFSATNLSMFGMGKRANTIDKAIVNLIGGRTVTHWDFV